MVSDSGRSSILRVIFRVLSDKMALKINDRPNSRSLDFISLRFRNLVDMTIQNVGSARHMLAESLEWCFFLILFMREPWRYLY